MALPDLIAELKRRRVFRAAGVYVVAGASTLQAADALFSALGVAHLWTTVVAVLLILGLPLTVGIAWAFDVTSSGVVRSSDRMTSAPVPAFLRYGTLLILVVLVSFGGYSYQWRGSALRRPIASIAVLQFKDLSQGGDQQYFSDGIAEEILSALSDVRGLRVAGRTSSFSAKTPAEIGQLRVEAILTGSVRRAGDNLRITASLEDVASGDEIWSQTYDRAASGLFDVQSEIAHAIVAHLKLRAGADAFVATRPRASSLDAYDLYLQGLALWHTRGSESLVEAIGYFTRATEADSLFAPGWAGLALTYAVIPNYTSFPAAEALIKGKAAAKRALELDDSLPEAHAAVSQIASNLESEYPLAIREAKRAVALRSNYAQAHSWLGEALLATGQLAESREAFRRALELDPLAPAILVMSATERFIAGDVAEAIAELHKLPPELEAYMSLNLLMTDEYEKARKPLTIILGDDATDAIVSAVREAHQPSGMSAGARTRLLSTMDRVAIPDFIRATVLAGVRDRESALAALERASVSGINTFGFRFAMRHPVFEPYKSDPRFQALLIKAGIKRD